MGCVGLSLFFVGRGRDKLMGEKLIVRWLFGDGGVWYVVYGVWCM